MRIRRPNDYNPVVAVALGAQSVFRDRYRRFFPSPQRLLVRRCPAAACVFASVANASNGLQHCDQAAVLNARAAAQCHDLRLRAHALLIPLLITPPPRPRPHRPEPEPEPRRHRPQPERAPGGRAGPDLHRGAPVLPRRGAGACRARAAIRLTGRGPEGKPARHHFCEDLGSLCLSFAP